MMRGAKRPVLVAMEGVGLRLPKGPGATVDGCTPEPGLVESLTALRENGFEITALCAENAAISTEKSYVSAEDVWRMRLQRWGVPFDAVIVHPLFDEVARRFNGTAVTKRPKSWYKLAVELLAQREPTEQRIGRYLAEIGDAFLRANAAASLAQTAETV